MLLYILEEKTGLASKFAANALDHDLKVAKRSVYYELLHTEEIQQSNN